MFFVLSKLLNVLFSPLVWVVVIFVVSFFMKDKLRKMLRIAGFVVLLIFSNSAVLNGITKLWEIRPVKAETLSHEHRKVVVLGGMASENRYNGLPRFAQSSDRLWQGLWLLNKGYADTLIVSGGLGNLFDKQKPEGELLKAYLEDVGLMDDRIFMESTSRNTYENALNTAEYFSRLNWEKEIILVTSAFHVRRARACFEKQGFEVEVFPADPQASIRPLQWKDYIVPSASILSGWGTLFREWAGMATYRINGYI